ncbi:VIT1/CCC1 family protein [Actinotalea sp. M2MS4P-6]|uniref:VIT1/CCC1 transporter family protein n=1 Tax=Actinotalea sp. M2MS4P-6 TaxID=2983762 RepID=UPI0021E40CF7|nr:VIT1/CCC1 family protein [Actinotalea sp. M2MS4P-6]MCV2395993.1 VIT1/CCC1 family protein [Actinotalea sp. M2MS4P-6]
MAEPRTATAADLRRWRRHLADELAEAQVYRDLARHRHGEEREILLALSEAEGRHAAHWAELLGDQAGPPGRPGWKFRMLAWLARRLGSVFVLALAQRSEARLTYDEDDDATPQMAADERIHEEVVRGLAARGRTRLSGTFRAAVFGANDGLVSNLALVIGVAAAGTPTRTVLLTGLAGLLAGALSMGAGEFISVRSQRELLAASAIGDAAERALPDLGHVNELALVYRARGLSPADAEARAREVLADIAELGHESTAFRSDHPEEDHVAVGTDVGAALSSFTFFATGAAVPVLPWVFGMSGTAALVTATVAVGAVLLLVGALVGLISGGPPGRRALRQLAIGIGAAAVTYGLGSAFGSSGL